MSAGFQYVQAAIKLSHMQDIQEEMVVTDTFMLKPFHLCYIFVLCRHAAQPQPQPHTNTYRVIQENLTMFEMKKHLKESGKFLSTQLDTFHAHEISS